MKVGVIGAGWAGLSAAVRAADLGHDVTVFEASHTLGGRARTVRSSRLQARIDNGQHIMLGAYHETLALMRRLGVNLDEALQREPLSLESADGEFHLQIPRLPAPLHLPMALFQARGLRINEKWNLLRAVRRLQSDVWQVDTGQTVQQWLDRHRQSAHVQALFWQPLCIAALNTPTNQACAQLFANVLRDSLGGARDACDILLPRLDLSALWPNLVEHMAFPGRQGKISIRRGAVVTRMGLDSAPPHADAVHFGNASRNRAILLNDQPFDAAIIACNVPSVCRLLGQLPITHANREDVQMLTDVLSRFSYIPIATVTLKLAHCWALPRSMYLLREDRTIGHYGQWLFNNPAFRLPQHDTENDRESAHTVAATQALAQVVISDAKEALAGGDTALVDAILTQLKAQTVRFGKMPDVTAHTVITEKRATFAATPSLTRPTTSTPWPQIWLAGDWTDTDYPAVLEGAVRSGQRAAAELHQALG